MNWRKLGLVFAADGRYPWLQTHAAVPFAEPRGGSRFRVYFSSRNARNQAQTGFFDLDLEHPDRIENLTPEPVVAVGELGTFDESGAMVSWIVDYRGYKYLYYFGWNLGTTVPFRNSIGLALSEDGGTTFKKFSTGPILDRSIHDPCFVANPCVLIENGLWRMWYLSCIRWVWEHGQPKHYYHLKYAESRDGINWDRQGRVAIDFKDPGEYALARPHVIRENGLYKMWYSYRGERYRIGYAESADGLSWKRQDEEMEFSPSPAGWDSEMVEYAFLFDHRGRRYMLYNGNGYGKSGMGLAVQEN